MSFEYDRKKSVSNKRKHDIDFDEARALWGDDNRIEILALGEPEERWMVTGCIDHAVWTAIITYRSGSIRLISVRRARKEEKKRYEEKD